MKKKILLQLLLVGAFLLLSVPTFALTFGLNSEYSGGAEPYGPPPWLIAEYVDIGTGSVMLTMDATGLTTDQTRTEFVTQWLFNINVPSSAPTGFSEQDLLDNLHFTYAGSSSTGPEANVGLTANFYDLNPARGFDIEFSFPESNGNQDRFEADQIVVYNITSTKLLIDENILIDENSFDAFNSSNLGPSFKTVAHVQGIVSSEGDSGKITDNPNPVPEPATMLLVGIGLIGLAGFGRKRFKA